MAAARLPDVKIGASRSTPMTLVVRSKVVAEILVEPPFSETLTIDPSAEPSTTVGVFLK